MQTVETPSDKAVRPKETRTITQPPIRVLVVDDSAVVRRILSRLIADDPELEVVGYAANGTSALQQDARLHPDVITMDVEMPEMDGLAAVRALRSRASTAGIIMCSTLTSRAANATIDALLYGANDYVTKPTLSLNGGNSMEDLRRDLVPKIKQLSGRGRFARSSMASRTIPAPGQATQAVPPPRPIGTARSMASPNVIAIGVSTGGPAALLNLLPRFPGTFALPLVIVQHMPPIFTRQLADRLSEVSEIKVMEATEGMRLLPGQAVLAPGNHHMRLSRTGDGVQLTLDQKERENSCRPSVDVLFNSVAEVYGGQTVGVMLTGMGQDGLRGVESLKRKGAYIIAQDRESSVVWGMPGAVVQAGLADAILPLEEVASAILGRVAPR